MERNKKEPPKGEGRLRGLWKSLVKDGTADGALGFGIAGAIMIAASVIWTIAARRTGGAYGTSSLLCFAIGIYCFVNMAKAIRRGRDRKDDRR